MSDQAQTANTSSGAQAPIQDKGKGKAPAEDVSMEEEDSSSDEEQVRLVLKPGNYHDQKANDCRKGSG